MSDKRYCKFVLAHSRNIYIFCLACSELCFTVWLVSWLGSKFNWREFWSVFVIRSFTSFQLSFTALFIYCHSEFKRFVSDCFSLCVYFDVFDHHFFDHSFLGENFIIALICFLSLFHEINCLEQWLSSLSLCFFCVINLAKISESLHGIFFSLRLFIGDFSFRSGVGECFLHVLLTNRRTNAWMNQYTHTLVYLQAHL